MSGYAKALEGFLRLFPRKIKVTFIDADSGVQIGASKMLAEQLPEKFKRPVVIDALERRWRVLDAEPRKADDFMFTRKLVLKVRDAGLPTQPNGLYFIPSIAHGRPEASTNSLFNEFIAEITGEGWRQIELLPASALQPVEEELAAINSILHPDYPVNLLLGYEKIHVREKIAMEQCNVSFDELCKVVNGIEKGGLRFPVDDGGVVKDGFALRSLNYEYYGTIKNGIVKTLCLKDFDSADDELLDVLTAFGLILVIWCEGKMISPEMSEGGAGETDLPGADQVSDAAII
jgi:hypothetical protein